MQFYTYVSSIHMFHHISLYMSVCLPGAYASSTSSHPVFPPIDFKHLLKHGDRCSHEGGSHWCCLRHCHWHWRRSHCSRNRFCRLHSNALLLELMVPPGTGWESDSPLNIIEPYQSLRTSLHLMLHITL